MKKKEETKKVAKVEVKKVAKVEPKKVATVKAIAKPVTTETLKPVEPELKPEESTKEELQPVEPELKPKESTKEELPENEKGSKKDLVEISQENLKIKMVPDACDIVAKGFETRGKVGYYEEDNDACIDCKKEFPESAAICEYNTKVELAISKQKTQKRVYNKTNRQKTPLGGLISSGAGKMELLMLRKEGATMEEMQECRGAAGSHIASLKKRGVTIINKDGKYFAKVK